jgi:hypothetical protein
VRWRRAEDKRGRSVQLLSGYEESGLPRRQYCRRLGIAVSPFKYYRQKATRKAAAQRRSAAKLVKVRVEPPAEPSRSVFTLVLCKGRPIESAWDFGEAELSRLNPRRRDCVENVRARTGYQGSISAPSGRTCAKASKDSSDWCAISSGRSAERTSVPLHESLAHKTESACLGWQRTMVCAKRLERGRSRWADGKDSSSISMRPGEPAMLVNGMDRPYLNPCCCSQTATLRFCKPLPLDDAFRIARPRSLGGSLQDYEVLGRSIGKRSSPVFNYLQVFEQKGVLPKSSGSVLLQLGVQRME